jgi:hypothetical protein
VSPTAFVLSADFRLRALGTAPPAHGLTLSQSGAGSGQYDARSMCAYADAGINDAAMTTASAVNERLDNPTPLP